MKKRENLILFIVSTVIIILFIGITSCGKLAPFFNSANTNLTSRTFSGLSANSLTALGTLEGGFWKVNPTKITGKVVTVFFPINDKEDEGVVVYGYYRPDIAKENASLLDFDLSQTTRLSGIISKKPGYIGGKANIIMMCYGYFDVYFTHTSSTTSEVFRFCYGTSDPYQRGDVLRKDPVTDEFKWLDKNATPNQWVSSRPANPHKISSVAIFSDPGHPDMKYFPLAAKITLPSSGIDLPASLIDNNDLTFTVDFDFNKTLLFENITSSNEYTSTSIIDLIKKVDMSQNRTDWYNVSSSTESSAIINCSVTLEATPKKGP